jgi:hypothetical protein
MLNLKKNFDDINKKSLIIYGEKDELINKDTLERFSKLNKIKTIIIKDGDHILNSIA